MRTTLLLAEDETDLGLILLERLRAAGYRATLCENGAVAWAYLQKEGPADLAVIDVKMPEMDGLELCRRIRARPDLASMPILMLTAKKGEEDQVQGYETGADDYLTKPFDVPVLLARLKALKRRLQGPS